MPIDLDYVDAEGILRVTTTGPVELDEYREAMRRITSDERFPSTVPTIWDLRAFAFEGLDRSLAEAVSSVRAEFPDRRSARIAYVVSDALGYGMMRMITALTDTADARESLVTFDCEAAVAWLRAESDPSR